MPDDPVDQQEKQGYESRFAAQRRPQQQQPPNASRFAPAFGTDDEKRRNIFYRQTAQAIREFRSMMGNENARGPLTQQERKLIRDIVNEAKADVKKYKIPLEVAASLRFASREARLNHDQFMHRMIQTGGNISGADAAGLARSGPFKFDVPKWLYMIKVHGPEHGLDYFANEISVQQKGTHVALEVRDPTILRQIISLRDNPRVSAMMGAEFLKHQAEIPRISYKGAGFAPDAATKARQEDLMTLGFDLGIRGADGVRGPLTTAAMHEYMLMSKMYGTHKIVNVDRAIDADARQARIDSQKFTNKWRNVSPADAFAIRHAAGVVGVDFGFMMELAQSESGFKTDVKADTSSAVGLFQFTNDTWMTMLYHHGRKYGLGDITRNIEVRKNRAGVVVSADIKDPMIEKYALDLRKDPRINALMGAEFVKENQQLLAAALPRQQITRADQYMAHFLGTGDAVQFLSKMKKTPEAAAKDAFPQAARSNEGVFYKGDGSARSFREVYDFFMKKFYTKSFDNASVPKPEQKKPAAKKPAARRD